MSTRSEVEQIAAEHGFSVAVVEKVLRLLGILGRLDRHEVTTGRWLLKGGTALNLFMPPIPRLSIDIDVNYTGVEELEKLRPARDKFERALEICCQLEGCTIHRKPGQLAYPALRCQI